MSLAIGLLLIGSGIAIHLEDVRGLERGEALALAGELGSAIRARTATTPRLDDPVWGDCAEPDRCLNAIRQRTGASELVLLRAFAAGARMRVTVELAGSGRDPMRLDLSRDPASWAEPMRQVSNTLFLPGKAVFEPEYVPPAPPGPNVGPFITSAGGMVLLGVGIALGASSASTFDELHAGVGRAAVVDPEASAASAEGAIANVLIGAGAAALVGGVAWWWWGE